MSFPRLVWDEHANEVGCLVSLNLSFHVELNKRYYFQEKDISSSVLVFCQLW